MYVNISELCWQERGIVVVVVISWTEVQFAVVAGGGSGIPVLGFSLTRTPPAATTHTQTLSSHMEDEDHTRQFGNLPQLKLSMSWYSQPSISILKTDELRKRKIIPMLIKILHILLLCQLVQWFVSRFRRQHQWSSLYLVPAATSHRHSPYHSRQSPHQLQCYHQHHQ